MRTRPRPLLLLIASLLAAALLAAGCGGESDSDSDDDGRDVATTSEHDGMDDDEHAMEDEPAEEHAAAPANDADATFQIRVKDGQVIGGPRSMRAKAGDDVRIEILSDAKDEVHVHGIDMSAKVPQGMPAVLEFTADVAGSYELEFHDNGLVLGSVVVS